ncbi:MAG TPA: hypothetical protein VK508_15640 [Cyclobacteriaceae bacterium]|nr:hypothetical protein [Cyclobacteriaceae bacterium]
MEIRINLVQDWVALLSRELIARGFLIDPADDENDIGIKYFNYQKRMIESRARKIVKSDVFSCPEDLLIGLETVEDKIKQGLDLTPNLSTRIADLNYNDDLLNDWGIYHMHLGTALDARGFVTRTGPLLFARFDEGIAYFINVMPHGSWTKQEMLKIVHRNWPDSISDYSVKDIVGLVHVPTDDEIKAFRKGNVNTMIEIEPGIVYTQPGGGYATNGVSFRAVRANNWYRKKMTVIEKRFKEQLGEILAGNNHLELSQEAVLEFHLQIDGQNIFIVEAGNRIAINCGTL